MAKPKVHAQIRGSIGEYHSSEKSEEAMESGKHSGPKPRSKYKPKGIDPAYPNKNFVKAHYENKGDSQGFSDHLYGPINGPFASPYSRNENPTRKASGYGHSVGQRAGKLRLSGSPKAHRIGKR